MAGRSYKPYAVSADGQVCVGRGVLVGAQLRAGSDYATLNLHDGTGTGDRLICVLGAKASDLPDRWNAPGADAGEGGGIAFERGLYANISGTNPNAVVYIGLT